METQNHWRALFGLLTPHGGRVTVMTLVIAVAGLLPLAGPLLIAAFIDEAADGATESRLLFLAGVYVAIGVCRQLLAVAVAWTSTDLAWRVTNELRTTLARHVLGLDLSFHRSTSPGELVSRVDGDVTALSEFISTFLSRAAAALFTLIGLLVVVTWRSWPVGLAMAAYLTLALGTMWLLRDKAVSESASEQAATGRMLGEVEERLTGADDLRSNGGGSHAVATFQEASAAVLRSSLDRERQGVGLWIMSNFVFVAGGIAVLAADAVLLRRGTISLGTAYLLFQYTQVLRAPLDRLADETERVQRAAGGMRRTLELLAEESAILDNGRTPLPVGALGVELDGVCFEYDDEEAAPAVEEAERSDALVDGADGADGADPSGLPARPADAFRVIDHLTLSVEPGRTLGVLGRTGSGKTTLARLLLRLVEPTAGTIRFGGVELADARIADLRRRAGVVSQDVHLFGASIRDNLTLFDTTIADSSVRSALADLDLLDWVDAMPDGLDTELGPAGEGLSGGEGQLIALTRLFLRDPDFVLLDEASSRIDPTTEARVTHAIDRLLDGRTAIVIAHRLSTVERLDDILVLDGGRMAEHGPTTELRADPASRYSQLLAVGSGDTIDEAVSS